MRQRFASGEKAIPVRFRDRDFWHDLGENFCAFRVRDLAFNAECPFEGNYPLEELEAVPIRELQFFRAGCEGWILVDEALFENQEIERGTTIGWGKVGPATTP